MTEVNCSFDFIKSKRRSNSATPTHPNITSQHIMINKYQRSNIVLLFFLGNVQLRRFRNWKCAVYRVYLSYMTHNKHFTILILICLISLSCEKLPSIRFSLGFNVCENSVLDLPVDLVYKIETTIAVVLCSLIIS